MIVRRLVGFVAACVLAWASVPPHPPQGAIASGPGPSGAACCGAMACCASGTGCVAGVCASESMAAAPAAAGAADGPRFGAGCGGGAPGVEPGSFDAAILVAPLEAGRRGGRSDRNGDGSTHPRPASMRTHDPPPRA